MSARRLWSVHIQLTTDTWLVQFWFTSVSIRLQFIVQLTPSFEGAHGHIRYVVKMELDRPWRFNKRNEKTFKVVPMINLNIISRAVLPLKEQSFKNLGIILFRHGEVTVEFDISKGGFAPSEMIVVNALVINNSSKVIMKAEAKSIKHVNYVSYHLWHRGHRHERHMLAKEEQELFFARNSKIEVQFRLQVPSTAPSCDWCPIIKVEYIVEVKFESTGWFNSDIAASFPIIVGTIPVGGNASRDDASLLLVYHLSAHSLKMEDSLLCSAENNVVEAVVRSLSMALMVLLWTRVA
ncbi:hypothetical protein Aduo_007509 [Ancylostoma duodenale]